jgi:hypothetical protein
MDSLNQKSISSMLTGLSAHAKALLRDLNQKEVLSVSEYLSKRFETRKSLFIPKRLHVRNDPLQLANLPTRIDDVEIIKLDDDLFFGALINNQRIGSILISNNDFAKAREYSPNFIHTFPSNFIIAWDIDSHHWFDNSFQLALFADLYLPAHYQCVELYERLIGRPLEVVPLASIQWPLEFLWENADQLITARVSSAPVGVHGFYPDYRFRNTIVEKWREVSSQCLLATNLTPYSSLSEKARLQFWTSSTTHLVAPVNGDLPFRFFDALATRSAVLVPNELKRAVNQLGLNDIDRSLVIFFDANDLSRDSMERLISIASFNWHSVRLQCQRSNCSLRDRISAHHVNSRIAMITKRIAHYF